MSLGRPSQLLFPIPQAIFDLSVAEKIFGLLALLVVVTGFLTVTSFQSLRLQSEYRRLLATSAVAANNVGRVNALIYAMVMYPRHLHVHRPGEDRVIREALLKRNRELMAVVADWKASVREDDVEQFSALEQRIEEFSVFRRELVRRATELGPEAGRQWGDTDDNRNGRTALSADLELSLPGFTRSVAGGRGSRRP